MQGTHPGATKRSVPLHRYLAHVAGARAVARAGCAGLGAAELGDGGAAGGPDIQLCVRSYAQVDRSVPCTPQANLDTLVTRCPHPPSMLSPRHLTHRLLEAGVQRLGARCVREAELSIERERRRRGASSGQQLQGELHALAGGQGRAEGPREQARRVVKERGRCELWPAAVGHHAHTRREGHGECGVEQRRGQSIRGRRLDAGRAHRLLHADELRVVAVGCGATSWEECELYIGLRAVCSHGLSAPKGLA